MELLKEMLIPRGFKVTYHDFSTHYTWDSKSKMYRNDDDPIYVYIDIPKSVRLSIRIDKERVSR